MKSWGLTTAGDGGVEKAVGGAPLLPRERSRERKRTGSPVCCRVEKERAEEEGNRGQRGGSEEEKGHHHYAEACSAAWSTAAVMAASPCNESEK